MVERVDRFLGQVGTPDDSAFVGCGPGTLAVKVALADPNMQVVGYDVAAPVIEKNRAVYANLSNITFEQVALATLDVGHLFDSVFCYGTLHYARENERAVEDLYDHVGPGGHLVFNYPNDAYRNDHRDAEGQLRKRLQLPIEGENLLSRERIVDVLDADVSDFWTVVDANGPFVRPANPCVVVDK